MAGGRIRVLKEQGQIEGLTSHSQQKRGSAHTRLTPTCSLESKSCFGFVNRNLALVCYLRSHLFSFFKYFSRKVWTCTVLFIEYSFDFRTIVREKKNVKKLWSIPPKKVWISFCFITLVSRFSPLVSELSSFLLFKYLQKKTEI